MTGRRRTRAALTLAATGGLALLATVLGPSASAGVNCPSGLHCVFWSDFSSSSHDYQLADANFSNDTFNHTRAGGGAGEVVDNNFASASNSSTAGYESHFWDSFNGTGVRLFCLNPGASASQSDLTAMGVANRGSSFTLPGRTSVHCIG